MGYSIQSPPCLTTVVPTSGNGVTQTQAINNTTRGKSQQCPQWVNTGARGTCPVHQDNTNPHHHPPVLGTRQLEWGRRSTRRRLVHNTRSLFKAGHNNNNNNNNQHKTTQTVPPPITHIQGNTRVGVGMFTAHNRAGTGVGEGTGVNVRGNVAEGWGCLQSLLWGWAIKGPGSGDQHSQGYTHKAAGVGKVGWAGVCPGQ